MKIEMLIFDFDGTLVHTAPDIHQAINEYLVSYGKPELSYEEVLPEIGMGLGQLFLNTFPKAEKDPKTLHTMVEEFVDMYKKHHLNQPTLFHGALEFIESWEGKIAILSNKREFYIHSILKHLKLQTLPWVDIIGGDTFEEKKPHRMPFDNLLKKAGLAADQALMIGDGDPDILGAKNCGMKSVAVSFGYGDIDHLRSLGAWKTIDSFRELGRLIESNSE